MRLHELVDAVTTDEPPMAHTANDIIIAGRRAERRRRTGLVSAGAAGLVVVAVAGAFALPAPGSDQNATVTGAPATTAPPAAFDFTFQGYDAGKLHVQDPIVVSAAYQMASIYADGRFTNDEPVSGDIAPEVLAHNRTRPRLNAYLTVYRPGAFDPAKLDRAREVTVQGRKALQATMIDPDYAPAPPAKILAWPYADNAWAVVTSQSNSAEDPSFADLGALVPGLRTGTPKPATLPFTVGYVPPGYQPVEIGSHALPGLGGINTARGGDYGGATYAASAPATTGLTKPWTRIRDGLSIMVIPSRNANTTGAAGQTKCFTWGECSLWTKDGRTKVEVAGAQFSAAELTRVLRSITLAEVARPSTWAPADQALRP